MFRASSSPRRRRAVALAETRLLSITLDPGFDTPQVLNAYAGAHKADLHIWTFATRDEKEVDALRRAFLVYWQTESGTISHRLATALIDKDGRIAKLWRGNGREPAEVIEEIKWHE
jgi:protein SCO1/2